MQTNDILEWATAAEDDESAPPAAMLIFAHPDDETIALGGRLGRFAKSCVVHVTDGAPRNGQDSRAHGFASPEEYGRARRRELHTALSRAGLRETACECLEIPDQETSHCLAQLGRQLYALLKASRPEVVFTHPYEGGHPDHDACAYAVNRAVRMLRRDGGETPPVVEAAFYHAGRDGMETGRFLPSTREVVYRLSGGERARKQALLDCFTTQRETLRSFGVECERYRIAPEYEFGRPPHAGQVLYEGFSWGMTPRRFCQLTREADAACV